MESSIATVGSIEELMELRGSYSLFKTDFCDSEDCAEELKTTTGGYEVRGRFLDEKPSEGARCIVCGGEARSRVLVAKAY